MVILRVRPRDYILPFQPSGLELDGTSYREVQPYRTLPRGNTTKGIKLPKLTTLSSTSINLLVMGKVGRLGLVGSPVFWIVPQGVVRLFITRNAPRARFWVEMEATRTHRWFCCCFQLWCSFLLFLIGSLLRGQPCWCCLRGRLALVCRNKGQSKGGLYEAGNTRLFLWRFVAHEQEISVGVGCSD